MVKEHKVTINWDNQDGVWWNETCISVIEVFGLPGERFTFHPHHDYMEFCFTKKKDADLCRVLLSEKL